MKFPTTENRSTETGFLTFQKLVTRLPARLVLAARKIILQNTIRRMRHAPRHKSLFLRIWISRFSKKPHVHLTFQDKMASISALNHEDWLYEVDDFSEEQPEDHVQGTRADFPKLSINSFLWLLYYLHVIHQKCFYQVLEYFNTFWFVYSPLI